MIIPKERTVRIPPAMIRMRRQDIVLEYYLEVGIVNQVRVCINLRDDVQERVW